ncbi:MAG: toxin-antitoxin system, toxin component, PIN family protein [Actinomycetia bacterium]|nr:toxin-antitoxin system, toxin component, PIN family protein [Actinomycetes bacterium]
MGGLRIKDIDSAELDRIIQLSEKYSDIPMDLTNASLIVISERLRIKEIITIDSDYYIYRTIEREMIKNIFNYKD